MIQNLLPDPNALGSHLQQLVSGQEFQALLQAHVPGRHQAQGVVRAGGPGVGHMLLFADIDGHVLPLGIGTNHHPGVNLFAWIN